jgi:uncharacterized protein YjbJ (UPF0337 family)
MGNFSTFLTRKNTMKLTLITAKLKQWLAVTLVALVACSGLLLGWAPAAQAWNDAAEVVKERAEQELDSKAGAGTANQVEGRAQEDLGRVQRQFGSDAEGAAQQAKGKAQRDIGRTQAAAEDASDSIGDAAQNLLEKGKELLGQ